MANELGLRNVAFEVDDLQAAVDRLAADGYGVVGGIGQYEQIWRIAYVRGPEGSSCPWPSESADAARRCWISRTSGWAAPASPTVSALSQPYRTNGWRTMTSAAAAGRDAPPPR